MRWENGAWLQPGTVRDSGARLKPGTYERAAPWLAASDAGHRKCPVAGGRLRDSGVACDN